MRQRLPIRFSGIMTQIALGLAVLLAVVLGFGALPAQAQSAYTQADLDAMIAPIALYPDDILGQVLIATTYPEDVAEARAYLDRHPPLSGALLAYQVSAAPWDDAVKSLTQFPSLLAMIDDQPDWTDAVGYAFLNQQSGVMRTVQRLRQRASRAGYLRTNSQQIVDINGNIISIAPVREGVYYTPYYDPNVVYGRWWWPNRQPYYWEPPARYRPSGYAVGSGIFFGVSVGIINSIFHPVRPDWHRRQIIVESGNRPGHQWKWAARPQRPTQANRPTRPNRPPTTKPVLRPKPQRPAPVRPDRPQIQPAKPQQPTLPGSGRPQIQPQRPGQGGVRPQIPNRPQVQPKPETPVVQPTAPVPPVTRPPETRPVQTRPTQTRPAQTRPEIRPAPARPAVTQPEPAPVAKPAAVERPQPIRRPAQAAQPKPAERPAVQRAAPNRPTQEQKAEPRNRKPNDEKPDEQKKGQRDQR
ncbi:MAG TPA: DUF3300 domain-containing protein [Rhizomicrobium sp.]|nr:DUF3300 domain-containing protein [Rhizomicrobium sp.]